MPENDYYSESAWKGERPFDYLIIDDSNSVFDKIETPSLDEKTFRTLRLIFICILGFGFFICCIWLIMTIFGHGLYWHKIAADSSSIKGFFISFTILCALIILCYFECVGGNKFSEYYGYKLKASERFNSSFYRFLKNSDVVNIVPSKILGLVDVVPSIWKHRGFKKKNGTEKYYWDEQVLIGYEYVNTSSLVRKIKFANVLNWIFIIIGYPLLIIQMNTEDVNVPAYIMMLVTSALLCVIWFLTKSKGLEKHPSIIFNRTNGLVTSFDEGEEKWSCSFKEFNAYIENQQTQNSNSFTLVLVPRIPIGSPRYGLSLIDWCDNDAHSCAQLWGTIQNFMNIKTPLPFVIPLETQRDKDPTSEHFFSTTQVEVGTQKEIEKFTHLLDLSDKEYQQLLQKNSRIEISVDRDYITTKYGHPNI